MLWYYIVFIISVADVVKRFQRDSIAVLWLGGLLLQAQTTQGLISGRVTDLATGRPLAHALVSYDNPAAGTRGERTADGDGYYVLPLLPPGAYRLRATAGSHQPREFQEVALAVAGFLEVNFELRPLADVMDEAQARGVYFPEDRALLDFYGPDVDSGRSLLLDALQAVEGRLESTVSTVISPGEIQDLPLAGRDLYTTLILLPAVTAETVATADAGLSVNGQRPTSSNFLLDGVENNNYLISGPLATVAPEAMQEYRISTSTFSAEYGGTGGVLANAVTRSGGNQWHGIGYFYVKNTALDANDFQRNCGCWLVGALTPRNLPRPPLHQLQPGFQAGGPLRKDRLYASTSFEYLRSRSYGDPVSILLPSTSFLALLANSPGDPNAVRALNLLRTYPYPVPASSNLAASESFSLPSFLDRILLLERLDYTPAGGIHHVMARVAASLVERPQFIWSPYQGFDAPLDENTFSAMAGVTSSFSPRRVNEARLSWSSDDLSWAQPHPEIPSLSAGGVVLPGSLSSYAYRNRSRAFELNDQFVWSPGRHLVKFGGGVLFRGITGYLTFGQDGEFVFQSILEFAAAQPLTFSVALDRGTPNVQSPSFDRQYAENQFHFFAQDTWRATSRFTINYGVRYENYGAPRNTGPDRDLLVQPAAGATGLAGATLVPESANQPVYSADNLGWAARLGASYALTRNGHTLLHGGYGIFYDRPYDNLWESLPNNSVSLQEFVISAQQFNYLTPATQVLPQLSGPPFDTGNPDLTWVDRNLRNGFVESSFLGLQQKLTGNLTLEVNGLETLGRNLISTDILNRDRVTVSSWPEVYYRANQGSSDYSALTALVRYRTSHTQFQASYTWSHSIDNQSSPLAGDFFNLQFTGVTANVGHQPVAGFSIAGDSGFDRGNSDFDQRQNLVLMSTAEVPSPGNSKARALFRNWRISAIASFRTGFPYSIYYSPDLTENGVDQILNPRASLVSPSQEFANQAGTGGRLLLTPGAFSNPSGLLGNLGRNDIFGPGLYNIDFSLGRVVPVRWLGEAGRVQLRADLFNVLNHANLGNPDSTFGSSDFGVALYGRKPMQTGFPGLIPLTETPRQVQLMLRVEW